MEEKYFLIALFTGAKSGACHWPLFMALKNHRYADVSQCAHTHIRVYASIRPPSVNSSTNKHVSQWVKNTPNIWYTCDTTVKGELRGQSSTRGNPEKTVPKTTTSTESMWESWGLWEKCRPGALSIKNAKNVDLSEKYCGRCTKDTKQEDWRNAFSNPFAYNFS